MYIHNYPGLLQAAGYVVADHSFLVTRHADPDYRIFEWVAEMSQPIFKLFLSLAFLRLVTFARLTRHTRRAYGHTLCMDAIRENWFTANLEVYSLAELKAKSEIATDLFQ